MSNIIPLSKMQPDPEGLGLAASPYYFGAESIAQCQRVDARLIICATTALVISPIDFAIHDGLRTLEEQHELYERGVSWTPDKSDHLLDEATGLGYAIDLVPYVAGRISWKSEEAFQRIGIAMKTAIAHHGLEGQIGWGALKKFGGDWTKVNDMAHWYVKKGAR